MPAAVPLIAAVASAAAYAAAPTALAALGATAGGAFLTAAGGLTFLGSLAAGVAAAAVGFGINALFPVRLPRAGTVNDAFDRTQTQRNPVAAHQYIVGRTRVSGVLTFWHTNEARRESYASAVNGGVAATYAPNDLRYMVVTIAAHRVDAVEQILLDAKAVTDTAYTGRAAAFAALGDPDQPAHAALVAETDGKWTTAHRQRGRANIAVIWKRDPSTFNSIPNISAVVRGVRVFDPRTGQDRWTANAALLVAWYLTLRFDATYDDIDLPSLIEAANICDERVPLRGGGTEARYTVNGSFTLEDDKAAVLDGMRAAMAGTVAHIGGRWFIRAGAWSPPSFTITADMLREEGVTVRELRPKRELYNGVRAVYVRPSAGYIQADAPPLLDPAALAADGGRARYMPLRLDYTVSGYRTQRLMQIALRRNRRQRQVQLALNLAGLAICGVDRVVCDIDRARGTWLLAGWSLAADGAGVDVVLEEDAPEVWAWNPATDERALPAVVGVAFPSAATLDTPAITVVTPDVPVPETMEISWGAVPEAASYQVQWRPPNLTSWSVASPSGTTATIATGGIAAFQVQAQADDRFSLWGQAPLPAPPTAFTAVGTLAGYDVALTLAADTVRVQLFAGTTSDFAAATKLTEEPTISGTVSIADAGGGIRYVWARSVAGTGNVGRPTNAAIVEPGVNGTGSGGGDGGESGSGNGDGGGGDGGGGDGGGDGD